MCRWIVLWRDGGHAGATDAACTEAEAIGAGRFSGACTARYSSVFHGFAAEVLQTPSWLLPRPMILRC